VSSAALVQLCSNLFPRESGVRIGGSGVRIWESGVRIDLMLRESALDEL
jgi:hypothetical protein